jgi:hypothetical protein
MGDRTLPRIVTPPNLVGQLLPEVAWNFTLAWISSREIATYARRLQPGCPMTHLPSKSSIACLVSVAVWAALCPSLVGQERVFGPAAALPEVAAFHRSPAGEPPPVVGIDLPYGRYTMPPPYLSYYYYTPYAYRSYYWPRVYRYGWLPRLGTLYPYSTYPIAIGWRAGYVPIPLGAAEFAIGTGTDLGYIVRGGIPLTGYPGIHLRPRLNVLPSSGPFDGAVVEPAAPYAGCFYW